MSEIRANERPNCREILNKQEKWRLTNISSQDNNYLKRKSHSLRIYIEYHLYLKEIKIEIQEEFLNSQTLRAFKTLLDHQNTIEELYEMIKNDLKSIIKSYYIFNTIYNNSKENQLFVNIGDKMFGIGYNRYGLCGQGHDDEIDELEIISEVCNSDDKVKEFVNGLDYVLCLTSENQLFSWGKNDHGQLGIGSVDKDILYEPQLIHSLNDVKIVQVCCGERHSLVLTEEGVVHGWGGNEYGQTGVGLHSDKVIMSPEKWKIGNKVTKIHCSNYQSFAITECGRVYSCGRNDHCQFGSQMTRNYEIFKPILNEKLSKIESIITSNTNTYFVTNEGDIYFCGQFYDNNYERHFQNIPSFITNLTRPKCSLSSNYVLNCFEYGIVGSQDIIYELLFDKIYKTEYKSFEDYFLKEQKMTYKLQHN